jgi:hypothetical protein
LKVVVVSSLLVEMHCETCDREERLRFLQLVGELHVEEQTLLDGEFVSVGLVLQRENDREERENEGGGSEMGKGGEDELV